jgi:uncharacterized protein (DUF1800 family)
MPLYGCPTPDGWRNTESAWLNPDAMTRRIGFATALASGQRPFRQAVDATALQATLGASISGATQAAVARSEPGLRAALLLGSPDFMRH